MSTALTPYQRHVKKEIKAGGSMTTAAEKWARMKGGKKPAAKRKPAHRAVAKSRPARPARPAAASRPSRPAAVARRPGPRPKAHRRADSYGPSSAAAAAKRRWDGTAKRPSRNPPSTLLGLEVQRGGILDKVSGALSLDTVKGLGGVGGGAALAVVLPMLIPSFNAGGWGVALTALATGVGVGVAALLMPGLVVPIAVGGGLITVVRGLVTFVPKVLGYLVTPLLDWAGARPAGDPATAPKQIAAGTQGSWRKANGTQGSWREAARQLPARGPQAGLPSRSVTAVEEFKGGKNF